MENQDSARQITRHDLRTPLSLILGYGQLLEMEDLTASQRDAIGQILAAGRELLKMIDSLAIGDGDADAI